MEFLQTKLEKANLGRSIAESKLSDFEREKTMIELEIKEILARHRTEVTERMSKVARVSWGREEGREGGREGMRTYLQHIHIVCVIN